MPLTEEGYKPRLIDAEVTAAMRAFGAVSIEGPKWCGKTWTALNHANSVYYVSDPSGNFANRERALIDPSLILKGEHPRLIDEWQVVPGIWDAVRFTVDRGHERGMYLLTGSATPPRTSYIHSGAGRIDSVRMRPMSLFESGESTGAVSLGDLLAQRKWNTADSTLSLENLIALIVRGGWPQSLSLDSESAARIPISYVQKIAHEDISELDGQGRDPSKIQATLRSLARNNASLVTNAVIERDTHASSEPVSSDSISVYLSALKRLYVLDEIFGWSPHIRSSKRTQTSPKRLFVDPSLAVAALGATPQMLLDDLTTLGFLFEGLCLRDLLVYAQALGASIYHYRDDSGLEAAAIIQLRNGDWGAFEIKLSAHQVDKAADNLMRLKKRMARSSAKPPSCLVVITGVNGFAHTRSDGIHVVPLDCLRS